MAWRDGRELRPERCRGTRHQSTSEADPLAGWRRVMELAEAIGFARGRSQGVLVTRRGDGRPQISNIACALDPDGVARISTSAATAKVRNLRRDGAVPLSVPGSSFWSYAVLEGTAELSEETRAPDDEVADELVAVHRQVRGEEHPDWDQFRAAMVAERRIVIRFRPERAYGQVRE